MISISVRTTAAALAVILLCACGGFESDRPAAPAALLVSTGSSTMSNMPAGTVACPSTSIGTPTAAVTSSVPVSSASSTSTNTPVTATQPASTNTQPVVTAPRTSSQTTVVSTQTQSNVGSVSANVVRTATVSLQGGAFFTNGWGYGKTVDPSTVVDGLFFPRNTQWDQGPVWWDSHDGIERFILIELDGLYKIDSFVVQADDNDAYLLEYRDQSSGAWRTAWIIPNYDVVPTMSNWDMETRPNPANNVERYVLSAPVVTDALRFSGNMSDGDRYFAVSEIQAFGELVPPAPIPSPVCASPYARLDAKKAGYGTPFVDGVMSAGEWENAARFDFQANLPPYDGGGTTPASLFVMNDGTNLYFALMIARTSFGGATNPTIIFDNNDDGCPAEGDDGFGMYVGIYSPPTLSDIYRYSCPGAPVNSVGCSAMDSETSRGILPSGTVEGRTAATNDGTFTYIEMAHPLNSGDALHDIALRPGGSVGFNLSLRLFSLAPACNYGWNCMADTMVPAYNAYDAYVRITTAAGATH